MQAQETLSDMSARVSANMDTFDAKFEANTQWLLMQAQKDKAGYQIWSTSFILNIINILKTIYAIMVLIGKWKIID